MKETNPRQTEASVIPSSPSIDAGTITTIVNVLRSTGLLDEVLKGLGGLLGRIFGRSPKPPAPSTTPVTKPTPREDSPDDFPDDTIPTPVPPSVQVARVVIKMSRAQYSKARFPEQYTPDNPMGLYSREDLRKIETGGQTLNWGSKFWLDLTAFDAQNREFTPDRVVAHGLAYKTEHHCGEAYIKGHGVGPDGGPEAGYETNGTQEIGNGDTAWRSSLGFLHQMKSHADANGQTFDIWGSVDGVKSNTFRIAIS